VTTAEIIASTSKTFFLQ